MTIRARLANWWRAHWYHQLKHDLDTLDRPRLGITPPPPPRTSLAGRRARDSDRAEDIARDGEW